MPRIRDLDIERTASTLAGGSYIVVDEPSGDEEVAKVEIDELVAFLEDALALGISDITGLTSALAAKAAANNVLALDNVTAFTPDADHEPATKKYVDDTAASLTNSLLGEVSLNSSARDIVDADAGNEIIFGSSAADDWTGRLKNAISDNKIFTFRNEDSTNKTLSAEGTLIDAFGNTLTSYVLEPYGSVVIKKDASTTFRVLAPTPDVIRLNSQSGTTYTLVATDASKVVRCTNAGSITVTVPQNTFIAGQWVTIVQGGTGTVTISAGSGVTIAAASTSTTGGQNFPRTLYFKTANTADLY
jgi:hypothetical protein